MCVVQASGEALYADDIPQTRDCLYAAFVASTEPLAVIKNVDARPALALSGVVAYFGADDIPGINKASNGDAEALFATDKAGQLPFNGQGTCWTAVTLGHADNACCKALPVPLLCLLCVPFPKDQWTQSASPSTD